MQTTQASDILPLRIGIDRRTIRSVFTLANIKSTFISFSPVLTESGQNFYKITKLLADAVVP